jgi:hypothetical protein
MARPTIGLLLIFLSVFAPSCKKDHHKPGGAECAQFRIDLADANKEAVGTTISKFIRALPSQEYTELNLRKLTTSIYEQCGIEANFLCFDCIKTLPTQSEIKLSFTNPSTVEKVIDISYNAANKMVFVSIH